MTALVWRGNPIPADCLVAESQPEPGWHQQLYKWRYHWLLVTYQVGRLQQLHEPVIRRMKPKRAVWWLLHHAIPDKVAKLIRSGTQRTEVQPCQPRFNRRRRPADGGSR